MEYAAIIIPTLNREKHLKRCVESIKKNEQAQYTDLFISVDFPPSDKYVEGYDEVKKYVSTISGFASVNVFYQEKNLGPGLNRKFLEEKISDKHDKYIFTDDDNEFANNFLNYMNWGLEKFKDDNNIYAVCSTYDFEIVNKKDSADYLLLPAYNPYGTGHWIHKNKKCRAYLKEKAVCEIYKNKRLQNELLFYSPMIYMCVAYDSIRKISSMRGKDDSLTYIDINENIYCIINKKECVIPAVSKSRNWGLDGSGIHSVQGEEKDYEPSMKLDTGEWKTIPTRFDQEMEKLNRISHTNKFSIDFKIKMYCKCLYIVNAILGNANVLRIYNFMRKMYRVIRRKPIEDRQDIMYG